MEKCHLKHSASHLPSLTRMDSKILLLCSKLNSPNYPLLCTFTRQQQWWLKEKHTSLSWEERTRSRVNSHSTQSTNWRFINSLQREMTKIQCPLRELCRHRLNQRSRSICGNNVNQWTAIDRCLQAQSLITSSFMSMEVSRKALKGIIHLLKTSLKDMMHQQTHGQLFKSLTSLTWAALDGVKARFQVRFLSLEAPMVISCKLVSGEWTWLLVRDKIYKLSTTRRYAWINWVFYTISSLARLLFTLLEDLIQKVSDLSVTFRAQDNSCGNN